MNPEKPTKKPGNQRNATIQKAIQEYIDSRNQERYQGQLQEFTDYVETEHDVVRLQDLEPIHIRLYIRRLGDRDLSSSSIRTYYRIVRAFLSFSVNDKLIAWNPAKDSSVRDELPQDREKPDRQFWTETKLEQIIQHINRQIDQHQEKLTESLDYKKETDTSPEQVRMELMKSYRDRVLVALLGYTGVRGAEILRKPGDDRKLRQGLRWRQIDIGEKKITVLGKGGDIESVPLVDPARTYLEKYREKYQDNLGEYVFPGLSRRQLYQATQTHILEKYRDNDGREIDSDLTSQQLLEHRGLIDEYESLLNEFDRDIYGVVWSEGVELPPSMSTQSARDLMKRLCNDADVDIDGEYMKPHGGRRGVGDRIYEVDPQLAQGALRHKDIATTHESYKERRAGEIAEKVEEID